MVNDDGMIFFTSSPNNINHIYIDPQRKNAVGLSGVKTLVDYGEGLKVIKAEIREGIGDFFDLQAKYLPNGNAISLIEKNGKYQFLYPVDSRGVSPFRDLELDGKKIIGVDGEPTIQPTTDLTGLHSLGINLIKPTLDNGDPAIGAYSITDSGIETLIKRVRFDLTGDGISSLNPSLLSDRGIVRDIDFFLGVLLNFISNLSIVLYRGFYGFFL